MEKNVDMFNIFNRPSLRMKFCHKVCFGVKRLSSFHGNRNCYLRASTRNVQAGLKLKHFSHDEARASNFTKRMAVPL